MLEILTDQKQNKLEHFNFWNQSFYIFTILYLFILFLFCFQNFSLNFTGSLGASRRIFISDSQSLFAARLICIGASFVVVAAVVFLFLFPVITAIIIILLLLWL